MSMMNSNTVQIFNIISSIHWFFQSMMSQHKYNAMKTRTGHTTMANEFTHLLPHRFHHCNIISGMNPSHQNKPTQPPTLRGMGNE